MTHVMRNVVRHQSSVTSMTRKELARRVRRLEQCRETHFATILDLKDRNDRLRRELTRLTGQQMTALIERGEA